MEPKLIADYKCKVGEGPLWHPLEKRVYWTDIETGRMFWYDPASGKHEQFYSGEVVGGFTIQEDGALLLFMTRGAIALWRNGKLKYVVKEIPLERKSRFNDVIADPAGRVFCGTMSTKEQTGRLYRLETDGSLTVVVEGIGVSNGMGFSLNHRQMYYTDSKALKIYLFDYDSGTGTLYNQRVFLETPANAGVPDGMTVDAQGFVWSARWDGSALYRYTPKGTEERRIQFPAKKVSSVIFGGDDLTDMYVTTAGGDNKAEEGKGAGALFRLNVGIAGRPEFFSRIKV